MTKTGKDIQVWRTNRPRDFLLDGKSVTVPENWIFVPSGDSGLTRRLKAAALCWQVVHKRKNVLKLLVCGVTVLLLRKLKLI